MINWNIYKQGFLSQDKGSRAQSSRTLEIQFRRALDEALEAYREQKAKKSLQELRWSEKGNLVSVENTIHFIPEVTIHSNTHTCNIASETICHMVFRSFCSIILWIRLHFTLVNPRNLRQKPPPYIRIDTNRPVGNVRLSKVDLAAVNRCDCEPNSDNPCGSDEKCLNR